MPCPGFAQEPRSTVEIVEPVQKSSTQAAPSTRPQRAPNPAFAKIQDDSNLPRVLLIGDSISIGYTLDVREQLAGKANVHRIPVNGGDTTRGLQSLDEWLGEQKWDVIHFNWGLHDLKFVNEKKQLVPVSEGTYQVPLDEYEKNLTQLVERLQKTGAKLIWRNTTPVPEGANGRLPEDCPRYNKVAAKIMQQHQIPIDDHFSFVESRKAELMLPANVHFTKAGYAALGQQAATAIEQALQKK